MTRYHYSSSGPLAPRSKTDQCGSVQTGCAGPRFLTDGGLNTSSGGGGRAKEKRWGGRGGGGVREGRRSSERIPSCCVKPREEYGCLFGGNRFQGRSGGLDNRMGKGEKRGVGGWRGGVGMHRPSVVLPWLFVLPQFP